MADSREEISIETQKQCCDGYNVESVFVIACVLTSNSTVTKPVSVRGLFDHHQTNTLTSFNFSDSCISKVLLTFIFTPSSCLVEEYSIAKAGLISFGM
jgi:hypothetical protein